LLKDAVAKSDLGEKSVWTWTHDENQKCISLMKLFFRSLVNQISLKKSFHLNKKMACETKLTTPYIQLFGQKFILSLSSRTALLLRRIINYHMVFMLVLVQVVLILIPQMFAHRLIH